MSDVAERKSEVMAQRVAKRRSIAIALALGFMVVLFYAATIVRFGTNPVGM